MAKKISELLVLSDLDGTLLQAGYGIPKENLDAIDRFVERGGRFTVATGRNAESVKRYLPWINLSVPAVICNGSMIYDFKHDKVLLEYTLDKRVRRAVDEITKASPQLGVELHKDGTIYVSRMNDYVKHHVESEHINFTLTSADTLADGWNKVLFADSPDGIQTLSNFVEKKQKTDELFRSYTFVQTNDIYYEIVPNGVNKASGVKKLAALLETDMKDVVAIGDFYNDIDMLKEVGYAVCVANAPAEVRAVSDKTVKSCMQGGVGELLDSLDSYCAGYEQLKLEIE